MLSPAIQSAEVSGCRERMAVLHMSHICSKATPVNSEPCCWVVISILDGVGWNCCCWKGEAPAGSNVSLESHRRGVASVHMMNVNGTAHTHQAHRLHETLPYCCILPAPTALVLQCPWTLRRSSLAALPCPDRP